jgi:hypothetical protein
MMHASSQRDRRGLARIGLVTIDCADMVDCKLLAALDRLYDFEHQKRGRLLRGLKNDFCTAGGNAFFGQRAIAERSAAQRELIGSKRDFFAFELNSTGSEPTMTAPKLHPKQKGRHGSKQPMFDFPKQVARARFTDEAIDKRLDWLYALPKAERRKQFLAMSDAEADAIIAFLQRREADKKAAKR